MKKIFTIGAVLAMAASFAMPAAAETKFSFKGAYRVRGFMLSNPSLQAEQDDAKATGSAGTSSYTAAIPKTGEGPSQSWMDMRLRMESKFTVSENLAVVTRFDALDGKKFGKSDDDWTGTATNCNANNNIDFDRAYMVIDTDYGKVQAGRMAGGTYGNKFLDTDTERDRVRFDTKLSGWVMSLVYEKQAEKDSDDCAGTDILTDADTDFYYAAATYLSEDLSGGLLTGWGFDKASSDNVAPAPFDRETLLMDPYLDAKFGDFGFSAEGQYLFGKFAEYDRDVYLSALDAWNVTRKAAGQGAQADVDWDAYAFNLEGTWESGPFGAEAGYAYAKGDDNPWDDTMESVNGLGKDWGKAFILTNTDSGFEGNLGGHAGATAAGATRGNLGTAASTASLNGCKLLYLGGSYSPLENLKISALYANSKAEAPGYVGFKNVANLKESSRSFASDHGSEYDLTIVWDIYDNLDYTFVAAFLDVGDYWQFGNPYRDLENTWAFWQQLKMSF